jgi:antitoxin (DNA-binding transcriptional repressor) of toxin-antitoxin stability system
MAMKAVNVSELKTHLSKYLRMASRGSRIIVKDRDEPVAELGPLREDSVPWRERLAQEGRLRLGTQNWGKLKLTGLGRPIDIQASLNLIREDTSEVRRH